MGFLEVSPPQSAWLSFWYQGQASTDKEPEQPSGALPGLANLGNTCFMNATLQCVLNTPAWLAEACRSFQKPELEGNGVSGRLVLGRGFADLLQTYNSTQSQALSRTNSSLKNMKSAIATLDDRYAGCKQQDAYEFLGCLLEGLEENFQRLYHHGEARAGNSPTAGIIRAICGVETHASRTCHGCKSCFKVDRVTDTALRLPLISPEAQMDKAVRETEEKKPISVEELLAAAQQPETIDGYDCDVCHASAKRGGTDHVRTSMTQQAGVISSTGDILVIVLYRFCHTLDDGPTKVRRQVACPTRLSLESGEYQLFGCVSHVGANLSSGHYIAAVRSHRDDMWYECDDETVKPLNINSLYAGKPVSSMRTGSDPYILFYHRQNRPQLHETQAAPQVEEANNSVTDIPEEGNNDNSSSSSAAASSATQSTTETSREGILSSTMAEVMALEQAEGDGYGDVEAETDEVFEAEASRLAEFTGQELSTCKAALRSHAGNADAAAAHLLSLLAEGGTDDTPVDAAPQPASSSSEQNEDLVDNSDGVQEDGYQAEQGEGSRPERKTSAAVDAARLAEATGKPLSLCLAALHAADGRPDRAAAELLFLDADDGDVPDAGQDADDPAAIEEDKTSEPGEEVKAAGSDADSELLNSNDLFSAEGGDQFVGVDSTDVGDDLLASHLRSGALEDPEDLLASHLRSGALESCGETQDMDEIQEESTAKRRRTE